ncbi:DNA-3-methyladenine glycosylase I [Cytobacillus sp. FSL W7-1323]|uniref:DNA-3-methyladenine glycosylase I n=1 Tax=Cytobacillus sp. FSL W7-1323 TaxID=2921700 RepID=UPI0031583B55
MYRCSWSNSNQLMQTYHDKEWGIPSKDDRYLFEMLSLEGAQAGLSWQIVLSKRANYHEAFHNFDIEYCASLTDADLLAIKENHGVIKHLAKLQSVRNNARVLLEVQKTYGSFAAYIWSYVDHISYQNEWKSEDQVPAQTELSSQISKDLKKKGFKFVGPVTIYSFMQAVGMVNDHVTNCICYEPVGK